MRATPVQRHHLERSEPHRRDLLHRIPPQEKTHSIESLKTIGEALELVGILIAVHNLVTTQTIGFRLNSNLHRRQ
ncbi:hypothetical protein BBK36DRAFT_1155214 [Trichoderma citrinoviride]|uniref:Uncharacterized protein n=1 Tax=Trichoderma citrinoviride TaxID=58853 RepID=A0A2T4BM75_9HYPO|nr:hypothetical protein BBK36DRAFT_1155214 [Trichoderma citrinoviride]PTB70406.1 hypothetical protein BBK36DRAFT_1155214 [Trichoderma citrinoviride]